MSAKWNGKFNGVGNGGLAGSIGYAAMNTALGLDYATASTGHRVMWAAMVVGRWHVQNC